MPTVNPSAHQKLKVNIMNPSGTDLSSNDQPLARQPVGSPAKFGIGTLASCILAFGLCSSHATLSHYQTAVTNTPSLIAYYTFEQNDARDAKGSFNGTLQGNTAFSAGAGGIGRGLLLDGTGRVNLGTVPEFSFEDTTGSVEAWIRAGDLGGVNATLFANRDGATRFSIHLNADKGGIGMWNGSAYFPTVPIKNPSTTWHHLVVVFDNGNFLVYLDGALAGSTFRVLGFTDTVKPTQLGSASPNVMSEGWVGMLDEVAFYADALTPETISAHYQAFFEGSAPVITDQPRGGTYLPGVQLTLAVKATGPNLAYQWFKGAAALPGKTETNLTFPSLAAGDAGTYSVTVTNQAGAVPSAQVTVAVSPTLPIALGRYQAAVSNETSLISYYTFDRLSAEDVYGPYDGTRMGTADWGQGIGGGAGQGLLLNGNGHVSLGYVPELDFPSGSGTVEAWVRADWADRAGYPCMLGNRDGVTVWSLHLSGDKKTLTSYNGIDSLGYTVPAGGAGTNWHHVAVVFDAGTSTYYWDGALIATRNQVFGTGPASVQFGSSANLATAEGWEGMLDEVAFYSTALPAASILAHYNALFLGDPPVITAQPAGGYFLTGEAHQLAVAATGAGLTYQWYKDGTLIADATNATLTSTSLNPGFSGTYYVRIANAAGGTNSANAVMQVGSNIGNYQSTVMSEPSLISYYKFDSGGAEDAKNTHPGAIANSAAFGPGPGGVTNQALKLSGSGHVDLGQITEFDFTNGGTVEGWVRPDWNEVPAYDPCIFASRDGGSTWSIHMDRWKNVIGNWNGDRFQTLPISPANGWHHYAVSFSGGKVAMFWDGKPIGTNTQSIAFSSGKPTQIGSSAPLTTGEGWMGDLDEVAFYGSALGPETIWKHYLAMVSSDTAPKLSYSMNGKQLTLTWPATATGFTLESSDDLSGNSWTAVGGVVNNQVTVDASLGKRFYRLRK